MVLYGELLYMCEETFSELVSFVYLMNEIVTPKNLWIGLNSRSDNKNIVYFAEHFIDVLDL